MLASWNKRLCRAIYTIQALGSKQWLCVGITALAIHHIWKRRRDFKRETGLKNRKRLHLLDSEISPIIMMSPSTSTCTFYSGQPKAAAAHLEKRVQEIIKANPWLLSVLDHDSDCGRVAAFYPESVHEDACRSIFRVVESSKIKRGTSYDEMVRALEPFLVKTSQEVLGTGQPLFSVILVVLEHECDYSYALVVSASHTLVDGHGFYKIHNMLSSDSRVESLSPKRKHDLPEKMVESMGGELSLMSACPYGFLSRFILGQIRAAIFPQTEHFGFVVSREWITVQKNRQLEKDVPWISTNDCVVSCFLNCLRPDCAMMAINFRGKIETCGEEDVGNYEELMTYMKGDYETPSLIRRSLTGGRPWKRGSGRFYRRAGGTQMLSNLEHFFGATYGALTNWSTFKRSVMLGSPGGEWGKEILHLPLFSWAKACPACIFGSIVIFRPAEGEGVAAMVAGKQGLIDAIRASGMVGEPLGMWKSKKH